MFQFQLSSLILREFLCCFQQLHLGRIQIIVYLFYSKLITIFIKIYSLKKENK